MATDLIATFGGGGGEKPATSFPKTAYSTAKNWRWPRNGIYNGGYTSLTDLVNISHSGGGYLESLAFYGNSGSTRFIITIDGVNVFDETEDTSPGWRQTIVPPPVYPQDAAYNGNYSGYDVMTGTTKIRFDSSLRIRVDTPSSSGNYIYWNYYLT